MTPRTFIARSWMTCAETGAKIPPGSVAVLYLTPNGRKVFSRESRQYQIFTQTKSHFNR